MVIVGGAQLSLSEIFGAYVEVMLRASASDWEETEPVKSIETLGWRI